jgi:hypothetical protein
MYHKTPTGFYIKAQGYAYSHYPVGQGYAYPHYPGERFNQWPTPTGLHIMHPLLYNPVGVRNGHTII